LTSQSLSGAVGSGASPNRPDDVRSVQQLLVDAGAKIAVDTQCGERTIRAIEDYQRNFLSDPDGRVDPGGLTWRHLLERRLKVQPQRLVLLPQHALSYYSYSPIGRQYATTKCVQALQRICGQFSLKFPGLKIGIGDISFEQGGEMLPHKTHKHGVNVDVRPLRKDKRNLPTFISQPDYSREFTKVLVACLLSDANVKAILFNDTHIKGVKSWPGHDNHLHVTMKG
jgi:hypothetical protein